MALHPQVQYLGSVAWAANGAFQVNLSPTPFAITEIFVQGSFNITTSASPGTYDDPLDRIISQMSLNRGGQALFSYTDMRVAYYHMRSKLRQYSPRRMVAPGASQTGVTVNVPYLFHLGAKPFPSMGDIRSLDNYDMSAGIPPSAIGDLNIKGLFGGAAAPGSGWTVNSGTLYFYGSVIRADSDGDPGLQPLALPLWSVANPAISTTAVIDTLEFDIPQGNFLAALGLVSYLGTNAPRSDAMLLGFNLFDYARQVNILQFQNYKDAEIWSQLRLGGAPQADDPGTPGTPQINDVSDQGLFFISLRDVARNSPQPALGLDMRSAASNSLQLRYGVNNATNASLAVVMEKYQLNTAHAAASSVAVGLAKA